MLSLLGQTYYTNNAGLYGDDGLAVFQNRWTKCRENEKNFRKTMNNKGLTWLQNVISKLSIT